MKVTRREVAVGGILTIITSSAPCCAAQAETVLESCWAGSSESVSLSARSGLTRFVPKIVFDAPNHDIELALLQTLDDLSRRFGILPGFAFYDEGEGPANARASGFDYLGQKDPENARPDGTVLFGLKLLDQLMALRFGAAAVVAVCAHEFGHILSYQNGMIKELKPDRDTPPFRAEQFADYIAGLYAGFRKREDPDFPAVVFASAIDLHGGGTHGSSKDRTDAVIAGFQQAMVGNVQPVAGARKALQYAMAQ